MKSFMLLLCVFAACGCRAAEPAQPFAIRYDLPADGQVSLAVYNAAGQQVRTLLEAAPQKVGPQVLGWDGLDAQGQPVPAGKYQWKLIHGQGVKAEYLMSIGTSMGIEHVPAQHGGPFSVAVGDGAIYMGAAVEGSPMYAKWRFDGHMEWQGWSWEAGADPASLAADKGQLFFLASTGECVEIDGTNQQHTARWRADHLMATLALPELTTQAEYRVSTPLPPGAYFVRLTTSQPAIPFNVWVNEHHFPTKTSQPQSWGPLMWGQTLMPVGPQNGRLNVRVARSQPDQPWTNLGKIEIVSVATRVDAAHGEIVVANVGAPFVAWISPSNGQMRASVTLSNVQDAAVCGAGLAVAVAGDQLVLLKSDGTPPRTLAAGLVSPTRVSVDSVSGAIWVVEAGTSQQIKRFDSAGKLLATLGRAGGRRTGLYHAEDFLDVSDIAADGEGGFVITEAMSAPRRTARFDGQGKLVREWFGGQQFYTFAAPEPANPNLVWMDSQWGWMMQVEVDYAHRTWKPRACYRWIEELDPASYSHFKMAGRMYPFQKDRDGDGKPERYLWSNFHSGLVLEVDEAAGKLRPTALLGRMAPNTGWNWEGLPKDQWPVAYFDALRALGVTDVTNHEIVGGRLGVGWADANGDHQWQTDELAIYDTAPYGWGGGPSCMWLDEQNWRIFSHFAHASQTPFYVRSPTKVTPAGNPLWDWKSNNAAAPALPFAVGASRAIRLDATGNVYQVADGGGDGYTTGLDVFHSHGVNWPGTLTERTRFMKFSPDHKLLWSVGQHATRWGHPRGQVHFPTHVAGFAGGCVGITDYFAQPCHFWTTDGLYVGGLLDGRVDDGLPDKVYRWWHVDQSKGDSPENMAVLQYDMAVGGSLSELPNGDAIFMGAGWNNVPTYRVHGLKDLQRLEGTVEVSAGAAAQRTVAERNGNGLRAVFFAGDKFDGAPVAQTNSIIWFEATHRPQTPEHVWPEGTVTARFVGEIEPVFTEDYTFSLYLTGHARLWVDGRLVIDADGSQLKQFSPAVPLQAGRRALIRVEFVRTQANPELHLNWESRTQPIEHVPASALYTFAKTGRPTVAVTMKQTEALEGRVPLQANFTRRGDLTRPLAVRFTLNGTAGTNDFTKWLGLVKFPAGVASGQLTLTARADGGVEPLEIAVLTVMDTAEYAVDAFEATGLIQDADSAPLATRIVAEHFAVRGFPGDEVTDPVRMFNGSGLDLTQVPPRHGTNVLDQALHHSWDPKSDVTVDLGAVHDLCAFRLWNYNVAGQTVLGVKPFRVRQSETNATDMPVAGEFTAHPASGRPDDPGQLFSLSGRARYLRFEFITNHSGLAEQGRPGVGIGEIVIYGR